MAGGWRHATVLLRDRAAVELQAVGAMRPALLAYAGDDLVATVGLRPCVGGDEQHAVIEVLALLLPLGTDRIAACTEASIRPVDQDSPARRAVRTRALLVVLADASGRALPRVTTGVLPFTLDAVRPCGRAPRWHPQLQLDCGDGWIASTLRLLMPDTTGLARRRDQLDLVGQHVRCTRLGHDIRLLAPLPQSPVQMS